MNRTGYAYFIQHPRIVDDLSVLHDVADEQPYEIVKTIRLQAIDFENFITDMTVDRQFIEDYAALCAKGETAIQNAETIDRGYVSVETSLSALGADISRKA